MRPCIRNIDWWYWLAVTGLLVTGLLHWSPALALVHLFCAARTVHLAYRERSLNAFAVQVNVVFLVLVLATNLLVPAFFAGLALTCALLRVTFGYCLIARLLALLPVNRNAPLSLALVRRTLFAPPTAGSILSTAVGARDVARA